MAYVEPYELTKLDITALRKMDTLNVTLLNARGEHYVHATKRNDNRDNDPFAPYDYRHAIAAPVRLKYAPDIDQSAAECFGHIGNYPSQCCPASSILATLRAGDGIVFEFYADYHSTAAMARCGLHGDALLLLVYRKGAVVATFVLQTSVCNDNSARMVRRVASSAWYQREAVKTDA